VLRSKGTMAMALVAIGCLLMTDARADNFRSVYFDASTDELVVLMAYRGTNPNHVFTLQWGSCKTSPNGENEIVGEVLDSQAQDAARQSFKTTTRFTVSDLACRPAKVTLRTAPRFFYSLNLPAKSGAAH
jgi:hypothetical protein